MSDTTATALAGGLAVLVIAAAAWARSRLVRQAQARANAELEAFEKRLANPDLDGLERRWGHPLPASLRALYNDQELINSKDVLIGVPNPGEPGEDCYVAWFEPGDVESLDAVWPGCEGLFPIANNGFGDQFLIDPKEPDPPVFFHLHESGERLAIGVTLSAFLAAPRRIAPDE
jgi:hypothetical protein